MTQGLHPQEYFEYQSVNYYCSPMEKMDKSLRSDVEKRDWHEKVHSQNLNAILNRHLT